MFFIVLALILLLKEEMAIYTAVFAAYLFVRRKRTIATATLAASVLYSIPVFIVMGLAAGSVEGPSGPTSRWYHNMEIRCLKLPGI